MSASEAVYVGVPFKSQIPTYPSVRKKSYDWEKIIFLKNHERITKHMTAATGNGSIVKAITEMTISNY